MYWFALACVALNRDFISLERKKLSVTAKPQERDPNARILVGSKRPGSVLAALRAVRR
jgi:hypothetical protein